jgi:hypothetical protein
MTDRLYKSNEISVEEIPFKEYFNKLVSEFGNDYEIWIRNRDFNRMIAAGVVNRSSGIAVSICFKYGGAAISNPLNTAVIERIRHYLISLATEDLKINFPSQVK